MLCDTCQKREATNFLTHIVGDDLKRSNLCEECYEAANAEEAREAAAAFRGGCRYCGGKSASGGLDLLEQLGGVQKTSFMCKPCTKEYYRFLRLKLPGLGEAPIPPALTAKLKTCDIPALLGEVEAHMKKWVSERGAK